MMQHSIFISSAVLSFGSCELLRMAGLPLSCPFVRFCKCAHGIATNAAARQRLSIPKFQNISIFFLYFRNSFQPRVVLRSTLPRVRVYATVCGAERFTRSTVYDPSHDREASLHRAGGSYTFVQLIFEYYKHYR